VSALERRRGVRLVSAENDDDEDDDGDGVGNFDTSELDGETSFVML